MKTAFKVGLLVFGVLQLLIVLYISIPAIPKEIKNESHGTQHTFDHIAYDLVYKGELTPLAEDSLSIIQKASPTPITILYKDNGDRFMIIRQTLEAEKLTDQADAYLRNPFKRQYFLNNLRQEVQDSNLESGAIVTDYEYTLYQGKSKRVIYSKAGLNDGTHAISLDIKVGEYSYDFIFSGESWETNGDINKLIETVTAI